jgi:mannose-6-phosphate isomerase-like protein (cupin superfamily)
MIKRIESSPKDAEKIQSLDIDHSLLQDDGVDYFGITIRKPWGYEYLTFQNEHVAIWVLHLNRDSETSLHCHLTKKTSLVVLAGEVICTTLLGEHRLAAGQGLFIGAGVFHSTRAVSPGGAVIMETETPTNKKDLVRLDDRYGREHKGYEGKEFFTPPDTAALKIVNLADGQGASQIGECSILICRYEEQVDLHEEAMSFGADIMGVLKGRLGNSDTVVAEPGDVLGLAELQARPNLHIVGNAELMLVKKIKKSE